MRDILILTVAWIALFLMRGIVSVVWALLAAVWGLLYIALGIKNA